MSKEVCVAHFESGLGCFGSPKVSKSLENEVVSVMSHLLMTSEDSDVVGMKAAPQTPQGPRAMYGYMTPAFSGSP